MNITISISSILWLVAIIAAAYIGYRKEKNENKEEK